MPKIIDYPNVLDGMRSLGMVSQYYNSGAFGFPKEIPIYYTGWLGAEDPTIRPAARAHARIVAPPAPATLTSLAMRAWREIFPGNIWLMPKSQWAYELDFGSRAWLPDALKLAGVDPAPLEGHTDSPAIEFSMDESEQVAPLIQSLMENLLGSDFALAFPAFPVACTLHNHKQIWWLSDDATPIDAMRGFVQETNDTD